MKPTDATHRYFSKTMPIVFIKITGDYQYRWSEKNNSWYLLDDCQKFDVNKLKRIEVSKCN